MNALEKSLKKCADAGCVHAQRILTDIGPLLDGTHYGLVNAFIEAETKQPFKQSKQAYVKLLTILKQINYTFAVKYFAEFAEMGLFDACSLREKAQLFEEFGQMIDSAIFYDQLWESTHDPELAAIIVKLRTCQAIKDMNSGDALSAIDQLTQLLKLKEGVELMTWMSWNIEIHLANAYSMLKKRHDAHQWLSEYQTIAMEHGMKKQLLTVKQALAYIYEKEGDFSKACQCLLDYQEISGEKGDWTDYELGRMYFEQQLYPLSISHLESYKGKHVSKAMVLLGMAKGELNVSQRVDGLIN